MSADRASEIPIVPQPIPSPTGAAPAVSIMEASGHSTPPITRTDIEFLSGIAATGTLRGATKSARIKHSAAQRYRERLERRIGIRLTTGADENLRLTDEGVYLLRSGRRYLRRLNEVVRHIAGDLDGSDPAALRTLRIAAYGGNWDDFVDDLARHLPALLPAVVNATAEKSRELFNQYRVDAVYTWDPCREPDRLSRPSATYQVVDEPMWVGLPHDHHSAHKSAVPMRDLQKDHWIVGPGDSTRQSLVTACWEAGFEPRVHHIAESVSIARSLLWHTGGIALLPPLSRQPGDNASFLIRPLEDGPRRQYVLTTDPSVVPDHLARVLREQLRTSYRKRAQRLNAEYAATLNHPTNGSGPSRERDGLVAALALAAPLTGIEHTDSRIEPEDVTMLRIINESGSLNRAAPTLLISQPALTRRLKRLERRLGLKLLVRGYRGTALTVTAQKLLNAVTEAELDFHATTRPLFGRAHPGPVANDLPRLSPAGLPGLPSLTAVPGVAHPPRHPALQSGPTCAR